MRTFAKCSPYSSRSASRSLRMTPASLGDGCLRLFTRSLNSCRRSYDRRSLSNVRGHSSPVLTHEVLISLRSNDYFLSLFGDYFLSPFGRTIISWGPHIISQFLLYFGRRLLENKLFRFCSINFPTFPRKYVREMLDILQRRSIFFEK